MADMIMQYRIMPADGEVEYEQLEKEAREVAENYDEKLQILEIGPRNVGFGLQACILKVQFDENLGSEKLEDNIKEKESVGEVVVELMDRL